MLLDSGIDPEFLAALPEDLQEEVINQHLQEQRQRTSAAPSSTVNPDLTDFLDALPPDMREEVLMQQRGVPSIPPTAVPVGFDPASFFAALNPTLGSIFGRPLGGALPVSGGLRRGLRVGDLLNQQGSSAKQTSKKIPAADAMQLIDKPGLITLLKQLFVPESPNKTTINRLLLNLSENGRTRLEITSALLSILVDGTGDIGAVDRSFSQLSIKGRLKQMSQTKKGNTAASHVSLLMSDGAPHLVAQRTLESLTFLVCNSQKVSKFMLSEQENFGQNLGKNRTPKKGKAKEKSIGSNYPIVVLLHLLERVAFLSNPILLEQLVHLIAVIMKPLASIKPAAQQSKQTTTANTDSQAQPASEAPPSSNMESRDEGNSGSVTAGTSAPASQKESDTTDLKAPVIPEHCVRSVVHVLTSGDCSVKTFQYTLSIIQYLSTFRNNRAIITSELTQSAQSIADSMLQDIADMLTALNSAGSNVDVNTGPFAKFIASTSPQAKLLRVLKTVDFIYSRLTNKSASKPESAKVGESGATSSVALSTEAAAMTTDEKNENQSLTLSSIYDQLTLKSLWRNLGGVLEAIASKDHLVQIGTLLLPLIESFMVVSKPYVAPKTTQRQIPSAANTVSTVRKDISEMTPDEIFFAFTEEYRKVLNTMVRNNPSLMSGSFSLLIENPKILEFDNKRTYFTQQLHKRSSREHFGTLHINVRRSHVFEDSYHQLHGRSGDEIKIGKLNVRFYEEEGVDAGGVTREWFTVLARQMFNPGYALFKPSAVDKVTYQPNRTSFINPDHLLFFRFVGRIIGKAIYDGRLLDCYFTRSFYKCMLGIPVDWKDMEAIDPEFHKSLEWMLQNDITDVIDLTFSSEVDDFGHKKIIDLKPNGRNIPVTEENKTEYVALITELKLTTAIKEQIDAFLSGFYDIIPKDLVKIFNEQELELLISGLPDIDVDDWKNNTEYHNYTLTSPQIQWFWRAVRSFSQEERAKIIQFVTGTSKVPLEGFKALEGSHGIQKFNIHKQFSTSDTRLPSAHTW
jgi:E3 ubiquitin-protein ligase HUWE1